MHETDRIIPRELSELLDMEIGTLSLQPTNMGSPPGMFSSV